MRLSIKNVSIRNREVERKKIDLIRCLAQDDYFVDCSVLSSRKTKNSLLFQIKHNHENVRYVVKIPARKNIAKLEYDSLNKIQGIFTDPLLTSPKTFFYLPSIGAYCMEYVNGYDVKKTLQGWNTSHQQKENAVSLCGRWLKEFHGTLIDKEAKIDFSKQLQEYSQRFSKITSDGSSRNPLIDQLIELYPTIENKFVSWGHTHGDFKTDNMILKSDSIYGIDFIFRSQGYQIMDVVQFINNMFLLRQESYFSNFSKDNQSYENVFLASYFCGNERNGKEVLEWLRLYHLFTQWDSFVTKGDIRSKRKAKYLYSYLNHKLSNYQK